MPNKDNCANCGTSDDECMGQIKLGRKSCCSTCFVTNTHGEKATHICDHDCPPVGVAGAVPTGQAMRTVRDASVVPHAVVLAAAQRRWGGNENLDGFNHRVRRTAESASFLAACQAVWDAAQANCSCVPWPPEGPSPDCTVHGAIRAFNRASIELNDAHKEIARLSALELDTYSDRVDTLKATLTTVRQERDYAHALLRTVKRYALPPYGLEREINAAVAAESEGDIADVADDELESWTGLTTEVRETVVRRERVYMGPYGILPGACGAHPPSGYTCTRLTGHSESHVACNFKGEIVCVWAADNA